MNICFGEKLKELRIANNLTQEKLANHLGVSFQTISKWERGDSYPDINMLPIIAEFFEISIDDLLGFDKAKKEKKISEYLGLYDEYRLKDRKKVFLKFKKAVKEFPNDYRIMVRYMELFREEKEHITVEQWKNKDFSKYERIADEITAIYDKIQNNCTDDSIRIWSKRLMCEHLFYRYQCCGYDEKYRKQALDILDTMPSLSYSREYLAMMDTDEKQIETVREKAIEELLYLLQNTLLIHCISRLDDKYSLEFRINLVEHINELIKTFDNDDNCKNRMHLIYNYGRLGYFYYGIGNKEKAIECFKTAMKSAKQYDENPNAEYVYRFYEKEGRFHGMNMQMRIKELMTEHYDLSDEFKSSKDFQSVLQIPNT